MGRLTRALLHAVADMAHNLVNGQESGLPPPGLRTAGGGDFNSVGAHNIRCLKKLTALDGKSILEIGCGSGRNALALRTYDVTYHGVDVHAPYIAWCARISRDSPNFVFEHADIFNAMYNRGGKIRPDEYRFPLPEASVDLVLLTSVFTHMLEPEVRHYIGEIARVLKPGGAVYATFFLLNEQANRLIREGRSHPQMKPFDGERVKVAFPHAPEAAIAFDEALMREWFRSARLELSALRYGSWSGRKEYFDYQDVAFAVKV